MRRRSPACSGACPGRRAGLSPIGERIFLSKGLDPRYLGGGGWNVFRYRAERSGKVTLTFDYGPFDLTTPATKSVRYEVTVE
jgi:hypothetical protein